MVFRTQAKRSERPRHTVQTLGDFTYAIPEVEPRNRSPLKMLLPVLALVFFPITATCLLVWTALMLLGPQRIRFALLAQVIPRAMTAVATKTENQRKLLLQHVSGRVLDVGCGGGGYMPFLKGKASHIVALEPVTAMHSIIRQQAKSAGFQDYQVTVLPESIQEYYCTNPSASFDWVILGNVLCEVDDAESTLQHVHKLLKNGGHVYFSEHLGATPGGIRRRIQETINPWWKRVSGGCNCNRDSLHAIEGMADWEVVSWEMKNLSAMLGPFVMGLARKVEP